MKGGEKMTKLADRRGRISYEMSGQDRLLSWLYGHRTGRLLLKPLVRPAVSRFGGAFLDSRLSAPFAGLFIRAHKIDMSIYEKRKYPSYNAFFKRKLLSGMRPVDMTADHFVSPCDARLSVYPVTEKGTVRIKHTPYTAAGLLKNRELAEKYKGGYLWVFRLSVEDYHRYIYVDDGRKTKNRYIPGIFHTVNPAANDRYPIYKENTREYTLLHSDHFGTVLMMEVGALLVGRIENRHTEERSVKRGEEKGNFAFGGSTIVLMTEKGEAAPDPDILKYSGRGIETRVLLGEKVGKGRQKA